MTPGSLISLITAAVVQAGIPAGPTAAAELSVPGFAHREVLRIDRDFGKPQWELALDGWVGDAPSHSVEGMRLWWVNTDEADRRKPFSRMLRRHVVFEFAERSDGGLDVRLAGDGKEYRFVVERDEEGALTAFADVELKDGKLVRHCRVTRGRLTARRMLGVPVGVAALGVRCTDATGAAHDAIVPYRPIEQGPRYRPEAD